MAFMEGEMVTRHGEKYKTNEICVRFDISRVTLYRWESEGLLSEVARDWRGWRIYNKINMKNIEKIIKYSEALKIPAKKVVKFRVAKAAKDPILGNK